MPEESGDPGATQVAQGCPERKGAGAGAGEFDGVVGQPGPFLVAVEVGGAEGEGGA